MKFKIINRNTGLSALLFLLSFCIYFYYYQHLILNLNAVLFKIEGDSLKNYYTFVYHISNDKTLLNFSGLNFPFGEHVVYTDCQPLLTIILKALPFTHNYLIGIMHGLILLSFMITPLILFRIFITLEVTRFTAFFSALAIAVLSPQIHRLGGHFALAYGCIIPFGILLLLNYLKNSTSKKMWGLFLYNFLLFFIHPYFGLGLSLFCLISITTYLIVNKNDKRINLKNISKTLLIGLLPIVAFKVFMLVTDTHINRPDEPYGVDIMGAAANAESVFTPFFGPFASFLKQFFKAERVEWEALSYVGIYSIFLIVIFTILVPIFFSRFIFRNEITTMFIAAILFLFISFGMHIKILQFFDIEISTLNQFRAFGRFAWYFYFVLPIFLVTTLSNVFKSMRFEKIIMPLVAIIFFLFNMLEANYLLITMTQDTFTSRNIFNLKYLTSQEKAIIEKVKTKNYQAIIPLPVFHIGSEVYQRNGDESVAPAMIYSYHTGLPVISVMLSRTSLNESETELEILNRYKQNRKIIEKIADRHLLVISTGNNFKQDELNLIKRLTVLEKVGDQKFYSASKNDFCLSEVEQKQYTEVLPNNANNIKNVAFIRSEKRKPFIDSKIDSYETIAEIDSLTLDTGIYNISFHYHLKAKKFRYIQNNLIVIRKEGKEEKWDYFTSVRSTSGFYDDFIIFEERINIKNHASYQFILHGPMKEKYWISHFLLKPENVNLKMSDGVMMLFNNYPVTN